MHGSKRGLSLEKISTQYPQQMHSIIYTNTEKLDFKPSALNLIESFFDGRIASCFKYIPAITFVGLLSSIVLYCIELSLLIAALYCAGDRITTTIFCIASLLLIYSFKK